MASNLTCKLLRSAGVNSPAPFLYQTRTLIVPLIPRRFQHTAPDGDDARPHNQSQDVFQEPRPAENTPKPRQSYLHRRATSLSHKQVKEEEKKKELKAMTKEEKKIFANLLQRIGINADDNKTEGAESPQQSLSAKEQKDISELATIFDSVLRESQQKKPAADLEPPTPDWQSEPSITLQGSESPEDQQSLLAYSDLGFEPSTGGGDPGVTVAEAIKLVVKREASKIEFALFEAIEDGKGDMGLWQVCKERIFTMLELLGEESPAEASDLRTNLPTTVDQSTTADKTDTSAKTPSSPSSEFVKVPDGVPVPPVVAALYPKTLLIAFRLLKTHFPDSPLISQFRLTIKAHRTSNILGSSTDLYDELIFFYWRDCTDLPAVVSLLHEMDLTGLVPSSKTRDLLYDITRQRKRDLAHHRMEESSQVSWWRMPPNEKAYRELVGNDGNHGLLTRLSSRQNAPLRIPSAVS